LNHAGNQSKVGLNRLINNLVNSNGMKQFDIIMVNMSSYPEWQRGVSNRNYHVLHELVKSDQINRILAVDYPPLNLKRAVRCYRENMIPTLKDGKVVKRSLTDKLTRLSDKLYVYTNCEFFISPERAVKQIQKRALELNFGDFIIWSYYPPIMPYLRSLGQKLTVFDAVDNWVEHPSYESIKKKLKADYKHIKSSADLIFTVAEELQTIFDNQSNVYWIPNGVDLTHYQDQQTVINRDIADLQKPIIGYIGVVQDRVDIELIKFAASKNPNKSFVIVGPVWQQEHKESLGQIPNIHVLGYKSYHEAPAYIQQFDVALIPHKPSKFVTSTNPMKLYEYLACGKPVVATKGSGAEMFDDIVYLAADKEEFNRKIFMALQEDNKEEQEKRKKIMQDYSWNTIVKQMLELVNKKMSY